MPSPPRTPQLNADGAAIIPLTKGKVALVDVEDYPQLVDYSWYASRHSKRGCPDRWYAKARCRDGDKQGWMYLHRFLVPTSRGLEVDHANDDSLDNRRGNLRIGTRANNSANKHKEKRRKSPTSQFKGVRFRKSTPRRPWYSVIRVSGKDRYLGSFCSEVEAARAYDLALRATHGVFARVNVEGDAGGV